MGDLVVQMENDLIKVLEATAFEPGKKYLIKRVEKRFNDAFEDLFGRFFKNFF